MKNFDIAALNTDHADPSRTSDKYVFVPTNKIVSVLQAEGWTPVRAYGSPCDPYARHRIHFRRHSDEGRRTELGGDSVPEAVLFNAHNGTTTYKLMGGVFRLICSNGMIISEDFYGQVRQPHINTSLEDVVESSQEIVQNFSRLAEVVGDWKGTKMASPNTFAVKASELRWDLDFNARDRDSLGQSLLQTKRAEDEKSDLWTVFNKVQENMTRGGFVNPITNRVVKPVNEVYRNTKINQGLWELASEYANVS